MKTPDYTPEQRHAGSKDAECWTMEVREPARFVGEIDDESVAPVVKTLVRRLVHLDHIGLGYRSLDRPSATLSGGESQRVKLVRHRPTRCPSTRGTTGSMSSTADCGCCSARRT